MEHRRLMEMYDKGLAPGTHRNRKIQAARYIEFMTSHNADPRAPSLYDALQFVRHLFEVLTAPTSIKNALSGARSWISEAGGDAHPLSSPAVRRLIRGGERDTVHVVRQAPPLRPDMLYQVMQILIKAGPATIMPRAALLLGYFTLLRQSNLVSPSPTGWGGPHTLRRRDIQSHHRGLTVTIHSSKTITSRARAITLLVPAIPGSPLCPVQAWRLAEKAYPAKDSAPAFLSSLTRPLDSHNLTKILRLTLSALKTPNSNDYSLHSLRRGAAQTCQALGVPIPAIMAQGSWDSKAIFSYIPKKAAPTAPLALARYFGRASGAVPK